jgi:acyl-CoA thioester hydrolase
MRTVQSAAIFRMRRVVEASDIDLLGHANNVSFVRWVQDVAVAHSAALGLDLEAYRRLGGIFVVVRHEVDYLRPAFRADAIELRTWISDLMAAKCNRATELWRTTDGPAGGQAAADGELLARALTTWGFVELGTGRPLRMPDEVRGPLAATLAAQENGACGPATRT